MLADGTKTLVSMALAGDTAVAGGDTTSCGASARLFIRGTFAFVERSDNGPFRASSSSIRLGFLVCGSGEVGWVVVDSALAGEWLGEAVPRCFVVTADSSPPEGSSRYVSKERFSGEAVCGRAGEVFFDGEGVLGFTGAAEPSFASFGFGSGGKSSADVAGREFVLSLVLR